VRRLCIIPPWPFGTNPCLSFFSSWPSGWFFFVTVSRSSMHRSLSSPNWLKRLYFDRKAPPLDEAGPRVSQDLFPALVESRVFFFLLSIDRNQHSAFIPTADRATLLRGSAMSKRMCLRSRKEPLHLLTSDGEEKVSPLLLILP